MTSILPLTRNEPAAPAMQAVDGTELQQIDGGLALWFVFACGALVGAWRTAAGRDSRLAGLLCGLAAALCAVAGSQVIDYSLRNPTLLVMLWTLLGLAVAASRIAAEEAGPALRPARPTGTGVGS